MLSLPFACVTFFSLFICRTYSEVSNEDMNSESDGPSEEGNKGKEEQRKEYDVKVHKSRERDEVDEEYKKEDGYIKEETEDNKEEKKDRNDGREIKKDKTNDDKVIKIAKKVPNFVSDNPPPRPILPHELNGTSILKPVIYFPQPFSYPKYPIILYLKR